MNTTGPADRSDPRRDEEIAAYVAGTMPSDARERFEGRLEADTELKQEVEAFRGALTVARDWLNEEPPGLDRVARLPIPAGPAAPALAEFKAEGMETAMPFPNVTETRRPARPRSIPIRRLMIRWAAAAAIFIFGVAVGQWMRPTREGGGPRQTSAPEVSFAPRPDQGTLPGRSLPSVPPAPVAPILQPPPAPSGPSSAGSRSQLAEAMPGAAGPPPITRSTVEPDGRVVIETTLASTGSQAVWVIDGSFQLAQSNPSVPGGSR